jgi:hypothetical protein
MTVRALHKTRRSPTSASAGTDAAGGPEVMPMRTRDSQHGIDAPAPAGPPPLTGCDRLMHALAGTDRDELPVFGRFPA